MGAVGRRILLAKYSDARPNPRPARISGVATLPLSPRAAKSVTGVIAPARTSRLAGTRVVPRPYRNPAAANSNTGMTRSAAVRSVAGALPYAKSTKPRAPTNVSATPRYARPWIASSERVAAPALTTCRAH